MPFFNRSRSFLVWIALRFQSFIKTKFPWFMVLPWMAFLKRSSLKLSVWIIIGLITKNRKWSTEVKLNKLLNRKQFTCLILNSNRSAYTPADKLSCKLLLAALSIEKSIRLLTWLTFYVAKCLRHLKQKIYRTAEVFYVRRNDSQQQLLK